MKVIVLTNWICQKITNLQFSGKSIRIVESKEMEKLEINKDYDLLTNDVDNYLEILRNVYNINYLKWY